MKTEAERRGEAFIRRQEQTFGERVSDVRRAETLALFHAIFDPLPPEPEPEPVKSLAQLAYEGSRDARLWSSLSQKTKGWWNNVANTVIAAHESRRPKPTVDEVADALDSASRASTLSSRSDLFRNLARVIFPLFGCEP